jgi:hypothetical protein
MYIRALRGYEEALGTEAVAIHKPALNTLWNLGIFYKYQGELIKAKDMLSRALACFQTLLGPSCDKCRRIEQALKLLKTPESKSGRIVRRIKNLF